jgi:hypothetical protein
MDPNNLSEGASKVESATSLRKNIILKDDLAASALRDATIQNELSGIIGK